MSHRAEILAISQYMTRSHGQGKINLELFAELAARGHHLRLVASWLDSELAQSGRVAWEEVPVSPRLPSNWLRCACFRHQVERRVRRGEVTINNGAAAVVRCQLNMVMFVHSAWSHSPWRQQGSRSLHGRFLGAVTRQHSRLEKQAFAMSYKLVALSQQVRRELLEYCGIDESRVEVVVPGVDSQRFRPLEEGERNALRVACGLPEADDRPVALFVGEIRSRRKNLDLVLKALAGRPEFVLAVIGSAAGSPYPALAQRLGVSDRVHFLGHRMDVENLMRGADVFVFPTHYEPFGLVVAEAMASGLPVVVTRHAGSACIVEEGVNGWLLEDGNDSEGFREALTHALDPGTRARMGRAARIRAEQLTWKRMADAYERLLHDCR